MRELTYLYSQTDVTRAEAGFEEDVGEENESKNLLVVGGFVASFGKELGGEEAVTMPNTFPLTVVE